MPNGTFDRDDMRALADFSNLTGVTFNELREDRLSEEDLISSNELQCALSDSLTSLYLRTYKNKAKFYVPTGEELKTIQEAVTFFLPVMEEIVKDSPKLIIKFWNKTKNLMTRPDGNGGYYSKRGFVPKDVGFPKPAKIINNIRLFEESKIRRFFNIA